MIFNVHVINSNGSIALTIKLKVKIINCIDLINYIKVNTNNAPKSAYNCILLIITLDDNYNSDLQGIDTLYPNSYYRILNNLHLTSPFYTSSNTDNNNPF